MPALYHALEVYTDFTAQQVGLGNDTFERQTHKVVLEVMQHRGDGTVRCIAMHPTDGLRRGMEVIDTGSSIRVPVGNPVLGRMMNVLGEGIDAQPAIEAEEYWTIHRPSPELVEQVPTPEILETGIKAIDLLCPFAKGEDWPFRRSGCRQDRSHYGAHQSNCDRARRLFCFRRCRRTNP